mmetsp:Transcript_32642/g.83222  ORF Transcript_32642/g.83222 Transcript_32642/m.83222 type:complete len:652 (+) Transcript_32642:114-2069(+)
MPTSVAPSSAHDQRGPAHRSFFVEKSSGRPGLTYEPVRKLGEGAFGVAHLVRDRNSSLLYVLKTINKRQSQVPPAQLETEIRNLKACDHPHIIRLFEYYEDYENIYLIMECAAGGELHQVVEEHRSKKQFVPERWVAAVMRQCLHAIAYVHSMGIIHKDLKTENILLLHEADVNDADKPPHAVIIDLGIAELFSARLGRRARCTVVAGTPTHMAPEVWRGNFGPVADVWSLGVVMFELLSGEIPFLCSSLNSAAEWIRLHRIGPKWPLLAHTTNQARALCQRMLSCDERMRPTAQQCLGHSWFKEENGPENSPGEAVESSDIDRAAATDASCSGAATLDLQAADPDDKMFEDRLESALDDYTGRSKFEKMVTLQVASHLHTSQVGRVADLFQAADRDSSGTVAREELLATLKELGVDAGDAESYVACVDLDGNGRVEYVELLSGCIGLLYESLRGLLWQTFCILDVDGNGVLGREEIQAVVTRAELVQHGFPGTEQPDLVKEALDRMDVDSNGQISFDELCRHFLPPRPPISTRDASVAARQGRSATKSAMPALQDEEFAQLLDEIEADHGARASPNGSRSPMPSSSEAGPGFSQGAPAGEVATIMVASSAEQPTLVTELEPAVALQPPGGAEMSVDEELSSLLADIANGP